MSGRLYKQDKRFVFQCQRLYLVFFLQVTKIEWRDRLCKQHKCFVFMFERFKQYYLPHIFPQFSFATSLYRPVLGMLFTVHTYKKFNESWIVNFEVSIVVIVLTMVFWVWSYFGWATGTSKGKEVKLSWLVHEALQLVESVKVI